MQTLLVKANFVSTENLVKTLSKALVVDVCEYVVDTPVLE